MHARTVAIQHSIGCILYSHILGPSGKKLLGRGHVISADDARMLESSGLAEVLIAELEEDEIGEDEAVERVAKVIGQGAIEIRPHAGGRSNLIATEPSCVLVDDRSLSRVNSAESVVAATVRNFTFAAAGQQIASVKSTPFAVPKAQLEALLAELSKQNPVLEARPIRTPKVGVLFSDPVDGERARELLEKNVRRKLSLVGTSAIMTAVAIEEDDAVASALGHLLDQRPTVALVASTTAPAGPDDVVGRAMVRAGCRIERFLAPVEPGGLLLLSYRDEIPVVSAPGCYRSAVPNVVDLILPPMLARYRVTGTHIAALGHGGVLGPDPRLFRPSR
jgi:molybdenum cofactor cytidylyltransferase